MIRNSRFVIRLHLPAWPKHHYRVLLEPEHSRAVPVLPGADAVLQLQHLLYLLAHGGCLPARVDPDSCGNTNWDADPVAGRHPNASSFADPECNSFGKHIRRVLYCSDPSPSPLPAVMLTLTNTMSGSILSDSSGSYTFSSLVAGGSYTVTPTKTALSPGSSGIDTVDVKRCNVPNPSSSYTPQLSRSRSCCSPRGRWPCKRRVRDFARSLIPDRSTALCLLQ